MRDKLLEHLGHEVDIITYGVESYIQDVTLECLDCCVVIYSCETEELEGGSR